MSDAAAAWEALTAHLSEMHTLNDVRSGQMWDQQTYMPPKAAAARGRQAALIGNLVHERAVDPRVGAWLDTLERSDALSDVQRAGVRNIRRDYERSVRIPADLVRRTSLATNDAFGAWLQARQDRDFQRFAPHLARIVELNLERARCIDPEGHPYEVLLQDYDPGTTLAALRATFGRLREGLSGLIGAIARAEPLPELGGTWDVDRQLALQREVAGALGYDLQAGRVDIAAHPFTASLGAGDVRITTHVFEDDLLHGLTGVVHEAGHAMYEQGLPIELRDSGVGSYASLGLHESQSRFWENVIGRSRAFHQWFHGRLLEHFPEAEVTPEALYRAANRVSPGPIRVAADEVTYNLHVIVRFELEVALLEGEIAVADLPEAWNARYREYLGVDPADDAEGVLQDVHWSGGSIGYFPSYTLGNLYAASLAATLEQARPSMWAEVERGEFGGVLQWLREHVHRKGHMVDAPELVRQVVGDRDAVEDLLDYLWQRHGALYGLSRPR